MILQRDASEEYRRGRAFDSLRERSITISTPIGIGSGALGTNGQPSPPTDRDAILLVAVKALVGIHECIVEWIVSHLVNALHANTLAAPLLLGDMADRGLGAFALEV